MAARPISIVVIGWILIVFGALGILGVLVMVAMRNNPMMLEALQHSPIPIPVQIAFALLGAGITFSCGIGLLKRQNWARFLYLGWSLLSFTYDIITSSYSPLMLIPSIVIFLIIVYFLFTPAAKQYFSGKSGMQSDNV